MRILVVEDDDAIASLLADILTEQNYAVEVAKDGKAGWLLVEAFPYDLILLDVMLPVLDGISLCRRLRRRGYQMPVLLLTGKDSSHDKAIGLDAGADDYLVKPFDPEELIARIRALLRRGNSISLPVLEWGNLKLDPTTHEVSYGANLLHLTPKEYALLELFLRNNRRVFSCGAILEHIWSYEETPQEEAVRTHIKGLRQKLKAAGAPNDLIETVYGIGYRFKPLEMNETPPSPPSEPTRQQMQAALAEVWNRHKRKINQQVAVLEEAAAALQQGSISATVTTQAEREAHTLAGSLGTFGLTEASRLAKKIEQLFKAGKWQTGETKQLALLVKGLRQKLANDRPTSPLAAWADMETRPLLLIVEADRDRAEQLALEAANWEIRASVATNLATAKTIIDRDRPNIVLLDLDLDLDLNLPRWHSLTFLEQLTQQIPPVPVVVLSSGDGLSDRLQVVRLGGRAFLHKPVSPTQVLEVINCVLQRADTGAARVMLVDDDEQILDTLPLLLEPWGLKVTTLDDPRRFWEILEATMPDLLILDIKMPHSNGIELCQVVRNDARWSGLPILFLTSCSDEDTVNQVFAAGADDFVSKPIIGPELVTRIINRLERIKLLRSMAETDSLTRVSNRYKSTQDVNRFLALAKRYNQPVCLAILDLDHFKQVNDRYSHAVGDTVLRQLGQLLLRSFRGEDVVARWGGEEFMVGMYGVTSDEGIERLNQLLVSLRQQEFIALDGSKLKITFSAGVAQYPNDGTDLQALYRAADAALYRAKLAGRDRVLGNG